MIAARNRRPAALAALSVLSVLSTDSMDLVVLDPTTRISVAVGNAPIACGI